MQLPESTIDDEQSSRQTRTSVRVRRAVLSFFLLVHRGRGGRAPRRAHHHRQQRRERLDAGAGVRRGGARRARRALGGDRRAARAASTGPSRSPLDGDYLDIYETQAFHPEPSASMRDATTLFLEFDPPPSGEVFVVAYDAYIQPGSQLGKDGGVAVVDQGVQIGPRRVPHQVAAVRTPLMEIVIRALVVFVFLWMITRSVGRSTLGELSTFELLLYVTMGDLVQQAVTQQDTSVTGAVLAVGTFALATVGLSWVQWRFPGSRSAHHRPRRLPHQRRRAGRERHEAAPGRRGRPAHGHARAGHPPHRRRRARHPRAQRADVVLPLRGRRRQLGCPGAALERLRLTRHARACRVPGAAARATR